MKTVSLRSAGVFALVAVTMTLVLAFVVAAQAAPLAPQANTYIVSNTNDPTPAPAHRCSAAICRSSALTLVAHFCR